MNNINPKGRRPMKKRTIVPVVIAMGFLAGCDWSSWCSCTKKNKTHAVKAEQAEPKEDTTSTPKEEASPVTKAMPVSHPEHYETKHSATPMPSMPEEPEMMAPEIAAPHLTEATVAEPKEQVATSPEHENPMIEDLEKAAAQS